MNQLEGEFMNTDQIIALISSIAAVASIGVSIFLAQRLRKLEKSDLAKKEIVDALRELQKRFKYTMFFTTDIEKEIWKHGFESLEITAPICAAAHILTEYSMGVDEALRVSISEVHEHIKVLRSLRDSYSTFSHGKDEPHFDLQKKWPDWDKAKSELKKAKVSVGVAKDEIAKFLKEYS